MTRITHDSRPITHDRPRLGISGSSFIYVMPRELVMAAYFDVREGPLVPFDERQNRLMLEFMRELLDAVNDSPIECMECYHSLAWDNGPILDLMLDSPRVEFSSVHAPYGRFFNASSPDPEGREGALMGYLDTIGVARRLGAGVVVVHPGVDIVHDYPRDEMIAYAADTIRGAAEVAGEHGIRLGVEPLPKREIGSSLDEVLRLIEMIRLPNVGINFDVNHLYPPKAIPGMIRQVGDLIVNVHVSDQDGVERHWMPFDGTLDWRAVLAALIDVGYTGPLIYEVHINDILSLSKGGCREVVDRIVGNYERLMACRGV